ncbi:MAG: phosphoribosyltransferase [Promethearchaeota archaeon CR_4]|nr:MAG: phosphoribosyltransferase [Candidatus Lokiarchaeota archaeon CR_4]
MPTFRDRPDAGNMLVQLLKGINFNSKVWIAAIPNGGVPVAVPIANSFQKFLYVMVARKIQYPWTTEAGFGAITADGTTSFNNLAIQRENLTESVIHTQVDRAREEVEQRTRLFRNYLLPNDLTSAEIILIDDGLASGITTQAAILSLQKHGTRKVIVAVPTAHRSSVNVIEAMTKSDMQFNVQVLSPDIRGGWSFAVADAYETWYDEETSTILKILREYNQKYPISSDLD